MKIVIVMTPSFNPNAGGVQRITYRLGKYFSENGLSVTYYSFEREGHIASEFGKLFHAPNPGNSREQTNILDLHRVLELVKPEIVINQMPYEQELRNVLFENKQKLGYRLIGCLHNSLFSVKNNLSETIRRTLPKPIASVLNNRLGRRLFLEIHKLKHRSYLRAILDMHDFFVLEAEPNREELKYFIGEYRLEKVSAIPNSIPSLVTSDCPKEKLILHVGRLNTSQKRSDLLLPLWRALHSQLPDWRFVIVGDGPYKAHMVDEILRHQLPRVQMVGHQMPEKYYQCAAIFVMPSAFEGFPNTLIEAQSNGLVPVVFNSYAALSWIVNDKEDAMLVPAFDIKRMATVVEGLAKDIDRLQLMQTKAGINAARFTIEKVGHKWLEFFKAL